MHIVICGVKGSGKDTIGDLLVKNHGFSKEAFTKPLKEMVKIAFPDFTTEDLYGSSEKRETPYEQYPLSGDCPCCGRRCSWTVVEDGAEDENSEKAEADYVWNCSTCKRDFPQYMTPRLALETLGTEWGRRLCQHTWAGAAFDRIAKRSNEQFVITDCRFKNELEFARGAGAAIVLLRRKYHELPSYGAHESETELRTIPLSEFDYVFENDRFGLEHLPGAVDLMLKHLDFYKKYAR